MTIEKRYRYGKWERNTTRWKPWQRTKRQLAYNDRWPYLDIPVGPEETEYGTDEDVARDALRERFEPNSKWLMTL